MSESIKPPPGFRFDPFADARMGLSLFQMTPDAWLVPDPEPRGFTPWEHEPDEFDRQVDEGLEARHDD